MATSAPKPCDAPVAAAPAAKTASTTSTSSTSAAAAAPRPAIVRQEVPLPGGHEGKMAYILDNVLTPEECQAWIDATEARGYEQALVNVGFGAQKLIPDYRNSDRCIVDSVPDAVELFARIKDFLPASFNGRNVAGLNERLRFLRYDDGMFFKPHNDGAYGRANGEVSMVTLQLYLNEGMEGGTTRFLNARDESDYSDVVPKPGRVLIFQHNILHEGALLVKGRKYAMRTDVMFLPPGMASTAELAPEDAARYRRDPAQPTVLDIEALPAVPSVSNGTMYFSQ